MNCRAEKLDVGFVALIEGTSVEYGGVLELYRSAFRTLQSDKLRRGTMQWNFVFDYRISVS